MALAKLEDIVQEVDEEEDKEFNEATFKRIDVQMNLILEKSKKSQSLPLLPLLFDAEDQVQTVENFFDYAFLIKEKAVAQKVEKETKGGSGLPMIIAAPKEKLQELEVKQHVLSLNMKELKELAELCKDGSYGMMVRRRTGSRLVKARASLAAAAAAVAMAMAIRRAATPFCTAPMSCTL